MTTLTKKKKAILRALFEAKAPLSRDHLMDRVGSYVASRALLGLENAKYLTRDQSVKPTVFALTDEGKWLVEGLRS